MNEKVTEQAKLHYKSAIEIMSYVVDYVKVASKGIYTEEKQRQFLGEFYINYDFMIILSMFKIAVADQMFKKDELIFIKNLTEYVDFCKVCTDKLGVPVEWLELYDQPCMKVTRLVMDVTDKSVKMLEEFTKYCAVYFASHKRDFDDLMSHSFAILDTLSAIDGVYDVVEMEKKNTTVLATFRNHVEMYISKFKK